MLELEEWSLGKGKAEGDREREAKNPAKIAAESDGCSAERADQERVISQNDG